MNQSKTKPVSELTPDIGQELSWTEERAEILVNRQATTQTVRQEQSGAWEHAPGSKGGCARMSRQRETVLIVVYDVVHVQPPASTWSKGPRSQHNCVAGRTQGGGHRSQRCSSLPGLEQTCLLGMNAWGFCEPQWARPIDLKSNTARATALRKRCDEQQVCCDWTSWFSS